MASADNASHIAVPADATASNSPRVGLSRNAMGLFSPLFERVLRSLADGSLLFTIAVIAVWMLSRPFEGMEGDARVYLGRALADLDPAGVGRDMMFVFDGQSQFSIFPIIAEKLVGGLGLSMTSFIFAIVNPLCWLAGAQCLVGRFAKGRVKWAILMIVAVVPSCYGPFGVLRFAEQYAVPRPLAEACVMAALAFLIDRRRGYACAFLVFAAAFHPLMALPGFLIFYFDLCLTDRRWIGLGAGLALTGAIAAFAGLPLFGRLATVIDPDWLAILRIRNFYLFPTLWSAESFGFFALTLATIAVASDLLEPRIRFIFWSACAVAIGGIASAAVFGDFWPLLLVVQAQLWRMAWLTSVFAAMGLALCLLNLKRLDPKLELATAFIVLGWLVFDENTITLPSAAIALLLYCIRKANLALSRFTLNFVWVLVLGAGLTIKMFTAAAFVRFLVSAPADGDVSFGLFWGIHLLSVLIVCLALLWASGKPRISIKAAGALAFAATVSVGLFWDDRTTTRKILDADVHRADLSALLPAAPGEVYWIGGHEPWLFLGRPGWAQNVQGAGIVFSRPLTMLWWERTTTLVSLKLADEILYDPWTPGPSEEAPRLKLSAIDRLCARPDAPAAVVAPLEDGVAAPADLKFKTWQPLGPQYRLTQKGTLTTWHHVQTFLVVSCADYLPNQQAHLD